MLVTAYNLLSGAAKHTEDQDSDDGREKKEEKKSKYKIHMVPEKTRLSLTAHRAANRGFSAPKETETIVLLSGECSWQFKFKLISIERISMLFEELFPGKKVATDNL